MAVALQCTHLRKADLGLLTPPRPQSPWHCVPVIKICQESMNKSRGLAESRRGHCAFLCKGHPFHPIFAILLALTTAFSPWFEANVEHDSKEGFAPGCLRGVCTSALRVVCIPHLAEVFQNSNLVCRNPLLSLLIFGAACLGPNCDFRQAVNMTRGSIHWCLFLALWAQASLQTESWCFPERSGSRSEERGFSWISFQQVAFYWPLAQLLKSSQS